MPYPGKFLFENSNMRKIYGLREKHFERWLVYTFYAAVITWSRN
jgi:hypothetical protein